MKEKHNFNARYDASFRPSIFPPALEDILNRASYNGKKLTLF